LIGAFGPAAASATTATATYLLIQPTDSGIATASLHANNPTATRVATTQTHPHTRTPAHPHTAEGNGRMRRRHPTYVAAAAFVVVVASLAASAVVATEEHAHSRDAKERSAKGGEQGEIARRDVEGSSDGDGAHQAKAREGERREPGADANSRGGAFSGKVRPIKVTGDVDADHGHDDDDGVRVPLPPLHDDGGVRGSLGGSDSHGNEGSGADDPAESPRDPLVPPTTDNVRCVCVCVCVCARARVCMCVYVCVCVCVRV
jgi:hypothetical protein